MHRSARYLLLLIVSLSFFTKAAEEATEESEQVLAEKTADNGAIDDGSIKEEISNSDLPHVLPNIYRPIICRFLSQDLFGFFRRFLSCLSEERETDNKQ
jgi:hypothetical protein